MYIKTWCKRPPAFNDHLILTTIFPCTDSSTQKLHWIQRPPALRDQRPTFIVPSTMLDLRTVTKLTKNAILAARVDCNNWVTLLKCALKQVHAVNRSDKWQCRMRCMHLSEVCFACTNVFYSPHLSIWVHGSTVVHMHVHDLRSHVCVGPGSKDHLALTTAFVCTVGWSLKPGLTVPVFNGAQLQYKCSDLL